MANTISIFCIIVGLILCLLSCRISRRVNYSRLTLGLAILFISLFAQVYSNSMEVDIKKRGLVQTAEDEIVYELITIEANKENTEFYFYYRTEIDGVEGFDNKTISSENIFIVETNQCKPMIIETIEVYEYEIDELERWWLDEKFLEAFVPKTVQNYEIYVPEGTLEREYNLK